MKKSFIFLVILLLSVSAAFSKEVSVRIYSNKSDVIVGEMFKLSIEATGTQNFDFAEEPNWGDNVTQIRSEQYMNMSLTNGSFTQTFTMSYYLRSHQAGDVTIGPLKIKVKKDIYETNQITVRVSENGNSTNSNVQNSAQSQPRKQQSDNGYRAVDRTNRNYLLKVNVDKTTAYKNEPILISVDLYVRTNLQIISYQPLKLPTSAWIEKLETQDNLKGTEFIDGIQYQHYEIESKRVFISKEGEYEIPSVVYNFHGLSSSSFSWFSSYEPMTLTSEPFTIKILSLPNVPPDKKFSGLVGQFSNKISIDQTQLSQKDIATLTVELTGVGNFHSLQDIKYHTDDSIDVFSSKNSMQDLSGNRKSKKWDILLQPNEVGQHSVKVDDIVYFDTKTGSYQTLTGKTFSLNVKKRSKYDDEELTKIIHSTDEPTKNVINDLGDITYIKTSLGQNQKFYNYDLWFEIFIFTYIVIVILVVLFGFIRFVIFNKKSQVDMKQQLAKNAYKQFSIDINAFNKNLKKKTDIDLQTNIDDLYKILQKYFSAKFDIDSVEFTSKGLQEKLAGFVDSECLTKLHDLILDFDMIRYGGLSSGTSLKDLVDKLVEIIRQIESA